MSESQVSVFLTKGSIIIKIQLQTMIETSGGLSLKEVSLRS
jgi:hypothetical protein